jgi:indolepyruvate ferredoxin oxidoreductase beta subunit
LIDRLVNRGQRVRTDTLAWFVGLRIVAGLRALRRVSFRHAQEQRRLAEWLSAVRDGVYIDYGLGVEIVRCQRLIKGYSETLARSHEKFERVLSGLALVKAWDDAASYLRRLREAALADETGEALNRELQTLDAASP